MLDRLKTASRRAMAAALFGVLAASGMAIGALHASEAVPAAVAKKVVVHGDLWARLSSDPTMKIPVIVQFAQPAGIASTFSVSDKARDEALTRSIHAAQDEILADLVPERGLSSVNTADGEIKREIKRMDFSPMFAMAADADDVARLAANPNVTSIVEDVLAAPALNDTLPLIGMSQMYAAGFNGSGYAVAVLDSGVQASHDFLSGRVVSEACYNTTAGAPDHSTSRCPGGATSATGTGSAADCTSAYGCGHGTIVAGVAAGFNVSLQTGEPASGVARGADIVAINVLSLVDAASDDCPPGEPSCLRAWISDTIRGLERVYTLRNTVNIAAVLLSQNEGLSTVACDNEPMRPIINLLRAERIATVVSVGNDGEHAAVGTPGCISPALAVAASTNDDERAAFSNWGGLVDLVAPGVDVVSSQADGSSDTIFASSEGTSVAAAHVAGAVVALREAMPGASVSEIENALKMTGVPVTSASVTKPRIKVNDARMALLSGIDLDPGAPENNDFADSTIVGVPGSYTGSSVGSDAEPGEPLHASVATARTTVWWSYTPNRSGPVIFTTQGTSFDTVMGVYTGAAIGSLTGIDSNDDNPDSGLWSSVTISATAGTTYHVAVAGYNSSAGPITLNVSGGYVAPPGNDDFDDRAVISVGAVTGGNVAASDETDEPVHANVADARNSVWWSYTAVDSGTVTIDTEGSAFNTVLAVYTGSALDSLTEIAANDDNGSNPWSLVSFPVEAGTEYKIAAAGKAGAEGAISLTVEEEPPVRPANDNFANRMVIPMPGTLTGTNVDGTAETGEPVHAAVATARNSVWWRYTPTQTGTVVLSTSGSSFNTVLAVYRGSAVNALTAVASNNDNGSGGSWSRVSFAATAGTQYSIAVAGVGNASGTVSLGLQFTPAPPGPANDDFADRIAITSLGTVTGNNVRATAEPAEPVHGGRSNARKSVWWRYTPAQSGRMTINTLNSGIDTVLAVYRGTAVNALTAVASNDDNGSGDIWSRVTFNATAGVHYSIAVAGYDGAEGAISLNLLRGGGIEGTTSIVAATAPAARAAQVGQETTAYATIVNSGNVTAAGCTVAKPTGGNHPFDFRFRLRDYQTGALGKYGEPANIPPGGRQDYLMVFTPTGWMSADLPMVFDCSNSGSAMSISGVNTFSLSARNIAPADVVSNAVTLSGDGIMRIPASGFGFSALAVRNLGSSASLRAELSSSPISGSSPALPLGLSICRTNPTTGACMTGRSPSVAFTAGSNQILTFTAFAEHRGTAIDFAPASRRLYVHFYQGTTPVSSSSVAVCTIGASGCGASGGSQSAGLAVAE